MAKYRTINKISGKYVLQEVDVVTFQDMNEKIYGRSAVLVEGDQFMPENTFFDLVVGKFKVVWMTDNWVGMARVHGNKKIIGCDSVYVAHEQENGSYIFIKEYPKVSSIEAYFEILDYYQNFDSANYVHVMLNLATILAHVRDVLGVNEIVNTKYSRVIYGMSVGSPSEDLDPVHEMTLSKLQTLKAPGGYSGSLQVLD